VRASARLSHSAQATYQVPLFLFRVLLPALHQDRYLLLYSQPGAP
jgi:hypothetical protein